MFSSQAALSPFSLHSPNGSAWGRLCCRVCRMSGPGGEERDSFRRSVRKVPGFGCGVRKDGRNGGGDGCGNIAHCPFPEALMQRKRKVENAENLQKF